MRTKLVEWHVLTEAEQKEKDTTAEVRFVRRDEQGHEYTIYGTTCYESWQQWGAPTEVLYDNIPAIEKWREGELEL